MNPIGPGPERKEQVKKRGKKERDEKRKERKCGLSSSFHSKIEMFLNCCAERQKIPA